MQLVMLIDKANGEADARLGLRIGEAVVSVAASNAAFGLADGPRTMLEAIDAGPEAWATLHTLADALANDDLRLETLALTEPTLLAPIPRPRKNVMCVGRNYADHAAEQGAAVPTTPVFFTKAPTTVVGPDASVPYPPGVEELDYEGELALIIGRGGRDIKPADALDHVFGYTVLNDLTARDVQRRHLQWFKGKSFDATCPMGPAIVTPDEVGVLSSQRVKTYVNGELRQDQPVSDMLFDVATIIAELSRGMTLEPGDVIATGTPSGVGAPSRRFLIPDDRIEVRIDAVGVLRTTIGPSL